MCNEERDRLLNSISALEMQRNVIGEDIVDEAVSALRDKLDDLEKSDDQKRKFVTVLFCDLVGFTELAESTDEEIVRDVLNVYFTPWRRAIHRYGGTIEKYIGDALLAIFGISHSDEYVPENAVRAAWESLEDLKSVAKDLAIQYGIELHTRVGIHTGYVLLTPSELGPDLNVTGDTIRIAMSLEEASPPDSILISQSTCRHIRKRFFVESWQSVKGQGLRKLIPAYRIVNVIDVDVHGFRAGWTAIRTVGRSRELEILQKALRSVLADKRPGIVKIIGEAGIGKSRLGTDFISWLIQNEPSIQNFTVRAHKEAGSIPNRFLRILISQMCGIYDTDNVSTIVSKLSVAMKPVLDEEEACVVGHFIGFDFSGERSIRHIIGIPDFGTMARAYLFRYLEHALRNPSVIILEDAHWSDRSSLDLLAEFLEESPSLPVLVVVLTRTADVRGANSWNESIHGGCVIELESLSDEAVRQMIGQILDDRNPPQDLLEILSHRSGNNPYFIEELIGYMIEEGIIIRGRMGWKIHPQKDITLLPPTISSLLEARIDSLSVAERAYLRLASVMGEHFWDEFIGEVAADVNPPVESAHEVIDRLLSKGLVRKCSSASISGTNEYAFRHALLRDASYATLTKSARRRYHALVAGWLVRRSKSGPSEYTLTGQHWEMGGMAENAGACFYQAGLMHMASGNLQAAKDAFLHAVSVTPQESEKRYELIIDLGISEVHVSEYPEALSHLETGLQMAEQSDAYSSIARACNWMGRVATEQGRHEEAAGFHSKALEYSRMDSDLQNMAFALQRLGFVAYWNGLFTESRNYAEEAFELFERLGDKHGMAASLIVQGNSYSEPEYLVESKACYNQALSLCRAIGDRLGEARSLNNLAEVEKNAGDYRKAKEYYERCIEITRDTGSQWHLAAALVNLGNLELRLGEVSTGEDVLHTVIRHAFRIGAEPIILAGLAGLAEISMKKNDWIRAACILGYVTRHASTPDELRREEIDPLVREISDRLEEKALSTSFNQWADRSLKSIIHELIPDWESDCRQEL